jgi:hypothetical protein
MLAAAGSDITVLKGKVLVELFGQPLATLPCPSDTYACTDVVRSVNLT